MIFRCSLQEIFVDCNLIIMLVALHFPIFPFPLSTMSLPYMSAWLEWMRMWFNDCVVITFHSAVKPELMAYKKCGSVTTCSIQFRPKLSHSFLMSLFWLLRAWKKWIRIKKDRIKNTKIQFLTKIASLNLCTNRKTYLI